MTDEHFETQVYFNIFLKLRCDEHFGLFVQIQRLCMFFYGGSLMGTGEGRLHMPPTVQTVIYVTV